MAQQLYIGLMSGTSMDAVDAVLVDFATNPLQLLATHSEPFSSDLKEILHGLCQPSYDELNRYGQADRRVGLLFANACHQLLAKAKVSSSTILAIGSHGQTIRHHPNSDHPFTLQIGDPNMIAEHTGITTIADFRRRDMVKGGQGAPLTPAFHNDAFRHSSINRVVVNIGGIANITLLPADLREPIIGFDTGPGNTLLDMWARQHLQQAYDCHGEWASRGKINQTLLDICLADPYYTLAPPKSTGRDYFNLDWLQDKLASAELASTALAPHDVQATLCELTVLSVLQAIHRYGGDAYNELLICGGGVHNRHLMQRFQVLRDQRLAYSQQSGFWVGTNRPAGEAEIEVPEDDQENCNNTKKTKATSIVTTSTCGIDPDWVEAIAFAWLAKQTLAGKPGNLATVTGASEAVLLGGIYQVFNAQHNGASHTIKYEPK
jgi:anhydro-N-acetylmuramic acid kinase